MIDQPTPSLTIKNQDAAARLLHWEQAILTIGRDVANDIVIDHRLASRRHARLLVAEAADAAFVEDLGSRNGTFLNGEPIGSRTAVPESARVRVGATVFLVHLAEEMQHV